MAVSPLDHKAGLIVQNMTQLHSQLSTLEPPTPSATQPVQPDAKAWEMGRRAYLTWAVNKVASAGGSGEEVLEGVERDMRAAGGSEGVEAIGRAAG
jgi:kinetochore protein Mis12/MTW1